MIMGYETEFCGEFRLENVPNGLRAQFNDFIEKGLLEGKRGWCPWGLSGCDQLLTIESGKAYYRKEWLTHLIDNFFGVIGVGVYGEITWEGEEGSSDSGTIYANGTVCEEVKNIVTNPGPSWKPTATVTELAMRVVKQAARGDQSFISCLNAHDPVTTKLRHAIVDLGDWLRDNT